MVSARPAARFTLVDHFGRSATETDFRGRNLLVYFGFTHCRVVCPRSLARLSQVLDRLGEKADRIAALYITVDPARDTPDVMRRYLEAYPAFTGLTGSAEEIDAAKRAFRVFAERRADPLDPDGYAVPHSAIAYLMDREGAYLDHFTDALDEEALASRIEQALAQQEPISDD